MSEIKIVTQSISREELRQMSQHLFGDLVKAVVDIKQHIMAVGGELHADEEQVLLERGSQQTDLWGINLYHERGDEDWIEFDSMINIHPLQGNRSRSVEDIEIQRIIRTIVKELTK